MLDPGRRQELKARVEALIADLDQAIAQRELDAQTVELDQTRQGRLSRMDALQAQAMAQAAGRRALGERAVLRGVLRDLQKEDFGLCEDCEEPIAWPRLLLKPGARCCLSCAQARE